MAPADGVVALPDQIVKRAGAELWETAPPAKDEAIRGFGILPGDWAPAGDELTPTMKLKRRPIAEKYAHEIEVLYTRD